MLGCLATFNTLQLLQRWCSRACNREFVVTAEGYVGQTQVVRGVDQSLDREAIRVVNSMPKWNPGMNNGEYVNVWFTLPITFKLQ